jgi:hypothetical protein
LDEHIKVDILDVHMAMMGNQCFSKNQVLVIVAQMFYVEVVLGVQVDWRIVLSSRRGKMLPYQPSIFAMEIPLAPPKSLPTPTTVLSVHKSQP